MTPNRSRPLVLIHGYSAGGLDFIPLKKALLAKGIVASDINICNYVSLNNEITIKDIAEGLDRAFRNQAGLKDDNQPFDAIVHSTGMLVLRSWLTNGSVPPINNQRLKRLKHLIGVAPATWGSPQAHKGRTWLGTLVKGDKQPGPDFLNAGTRVLEGLELGSDFTWDLAHVDLLGPEPYYDRTENTPYIAVFIGNSQYEGLAAVANDPGTDGTVRWSGCSLNSRKIRVDLTRRPVDEKGEVANRATFSPWADKRLDVPIIAVDGRNHATIISNPDDGMVNRIVNLLKINDETAFDAWLAEASEFGKPALQKMLINPGAGAAGIVGDAKAFLEHLVGHQLGTQMEGWQQFVVRARDERGDPVTDYMVQVLTKKAPEADWVSFEEMYTDVHAYGPDPSYRCFHIRLPQGITSGTIPLKIRIHASTGTDLMAYQGYGDSYVELTANSQPVELDLTNLNKTGSTIFYPFTTTLIEIILNREPLPFNTTSPIFTFLPPS